MKIKIKFINPENRLKIIDKGEWIDLKSSEDVKLKAPQIKSNSKVVTFNPQLISLGVAMELPKYFEALVLPRSSTFKNFGVIVANSQGIIDSSYKGDEDIWKFNAIPFKNATIKTGDRIAQFRIQPSQFAPIWVKLRWLFTNKIKFVEVKTLNNNSRGGFGSTGIK